MTVPKPTTSEAFLCSRRPVEPYTCATCHYKTYFIIDWRQHTTTSPKEVSEVYYCTNCGFQTYSQLVLLRHVHAQCPIKVGIKTYVEVEDNTYRDLDEEKPPPSAVHQGGFECGQCSYRTESSLFYTMHLTAEHTAHRSAPSRPRQETSKYRCGKCPYQTRWKSGLKVHTISRHPKDSVKWHKCRQCQYMTKWKHNLQTHKITKHTDPEDIKWFECEQCPYRAKVGSCLRNHFLSKHTAFRDLKWLHCDRCPHKTRWKSNLKAHIRNKHPS